MILGGGVALCLLLSVHRAVIFAIAQLSCLCVGLLDVRVYVLALDLALMSVHTGSSAARHCAARYMRLRFHTECVALCIALHWAVRAAPCGGARHRDAPELQCECTFTVPAHLSCIMLMSPSI